MGGDPVKFRAQTTVAVPGTAGIVAQTPGIKGIVIFKIEIDLLHWRGVFCHLYFSPFKAAADRFHIHPVRRQRPYHRDSWQDECLRHS
jgi:hypothetical protein